jgi:hypothetical protein
MRSTFIISDSDNITQLQTTPDSQSTMATPTEFTLNVAYTVPVNNDASGPIVTLEEFWRGLRRGGEKPHLFAEYVAGTEILPNRRSENEFQRRLFMADGAVHTARGVELVQDVRNANNLLVSMGPCDYQS